MGAGMILLNGEKKILLVKPNYKDHWTLPGGVVEKDESPRDAVLREVLEEIGIKPKACNLVAVSYNRAHGKFGESLQWAFFGGVLSSEEIGKIILNKEEHDDFGFFALDQLTTLSNWDSGRIEIIKKALENGKPVYLENWEEIND